MEEDPDLPSPDSLLTLLGIMRFTLFWRIFIIIACIIEAIFIVYLLKEGNTKIKRLTSPDPNCPWNQTYSIISLRLLQLNQFVLVVGLLSKIFNLIKDALPPDLFFKAIGHHFPPVDCSHPMETQFDLLKNLIIAMPIFTVYVTDFILFAQGFEWSVMRLIIDFQKDKSIEEIQFNIVAVEAAECRLPSYEWKEDAKANSQFNFRKREKRCGRLIGMTLVVLALLLTGMFAVEFVLVFTISFIEIINFGLQVLAVAYFLPTFFLLRRSMVKMHRYEWERNRLSMNMQVVALVASASIQALYTYMGRVFRPSTEQQLCDNEFTKKWEEPLYIAYNFLVVSVYVLQIPSLLVSYTLIKLKSSEDILQGISKLDYLLKVSIFQKYRDKAMEGRKGTIGTVRTFVRIDSSANSDYMEEEY